MTRMGDPLSQNLPVLTAPPWWEPLAGRATYYEIRKAAGPAVKFQEDLNE